MNLVDRFTRDAVSRVVWGVCLVASVGLMVLAIMGGRGAAEDQRADSEARAAAYAANVIEPRIADSALKSPLDDGLSQELSLAVDGGILVDARVIEVRLWEAPADANAQSKLLFSTDPADPINDSRALNEEELRQAVAGGPVTITQRQSAEDPSGASALITYVPVSTTDGDRAEVEVVQDIDATVGAAESGWFRLQLLAGALVIAFLTMTILSFREPVARIGTGVRFVAEEVPPGYAVVEEERLRAVNDVYALAQERVERLKERLRMSENARLAAEGELQRVLSKFETPKRASSLGAPQVEAGPPKITAPEARPPKVEEPKPATPEKAPEPAATKPVEPEPVVPEPAVPEPVASEPFVVAPAESVIEAPAISEPEVAEPITVQPSEVVEATAIDAEQAAEAEAAPETASEPIVIPEPEPQPAAASVSDYFSAGPIPDIADVDDDEDDAAIARELLLRLMENEVPMAVSGVDPGEVRARLVKMAASKRPGGGERKPVVEEESQGPTPPWSHNR